MNNGMISDIKRFLLKLYGYWVISGFILLGLSLLWVWLTGSWVDVLTDLIISLVLESIIFPFNLLVTWVLNPLQLIAHIVIFVTLLLLRYLLETRH